MDSTVGQQHIHALVVRTLHAYNFTRSSAHASALLTDILERYIHLIAISATHFAQHAGRSSPNALDLVAALDDAGVSLEELLDYTHTQEAKDIAKYSLTAPSDDPLPLPTTAPGPSKAAAAAAAAHASTVASASRRIDALADLKASISEGLKQDDDDVIPLHYAPISSPTLSATPLPSRSPSPTHALVNGKGKQRAMDVDLPFDTAPLSPRPDIHLPMSPISNPAYSPPSSPRAHKRPRTSAWSPPPHIPDFLPPFPGQSSTTVEPPVPPPPSAPSPRRRTRAPLAPQTRTNAKPSYTKPIPHAKSSLPDTWNLPDLRPSDIKSKPNTDTKSASLAHLISAYNVLQTETKPQPATNPARLLIARSLSVSSAPSVAPSPSNNGTVTPTFPLPAGLHSNAANNRSSRLSIPALRRYDAPDTLFSSLVVQPSLPRHVPPTPSHPVPVDPESKLTLPGPWVFSKPSAGGVDNSIVGVGVGFGAGITSQNGALLVNAPNTGPGDVVDMMSSGGSYLGRLAKELLTPAVYSRTTRFLPPPPLYSTPSLVNGNATPNLGPPVVYNRPVSAPWNANLNPLDGTETTQAVQSKKKNDKDKPINGDALLGDAKLHATWDWTVKEYRDPLPHFASKRGRISSSTHLGGTSSPLPSPSMTRFTLAPAPAGSSKPLTNGTSRSLPSPKITLNKSFITPNPAVPTVARPVSSPLVLSFSHPAASPDETGDSMEVDPSSPSRLSLSVEPYTHPYPALTPTINGTTAHG